MLLRCVFNLCAGQRSTPLSILEKKCEACPDLAQKKFAKGEEPARFDTIAALGLVGDEAPQMGVERLGEMFQVVATFEKRYQPPLAMLLR